ncbi:MAG: hypothetical protein V2I33_23435, partial [Kangiellaceae bacterium]|nr:hypothetical protein [Kangiellaceae bacterium]
MNYPNPINQSSLNVLVRYQNSAYEQWIRIEKMKEATKKRAEKHQEMEKAQKEAGAERRSSSVAL